MSPPHHIIFLNPASKSQLTMNAGLEALRVFTPGVLDLDIMKNNRDKVTDRFWTSVLDDSDGGALSRWLHFIVDSGRSSHMWAVLQKP